MLITVNRLKKNNICVMGYFVAQKENDEYIIGYTLESPDLNNKKNVSCIMTGSYNAWLDYSDKYKCKVIRLEDKNNRTNVLIHPGNYPKDTKGCILVGTAPGNNTIWSSRDKLKELINFAGDEYLRVIVKEENNI